jgi:Ca-activated chloride channel family protein
MRVSIGATGTLTLTYVELPSLHQHTVTLPVSVNVVPADVAAGRVPNPDVQREMLVLQTQRAKRQAEQALHSGDVDTAGAILSDAHASLAQAPAHLHDGALAAESQWLESTQRTLRERDAAYNVKRLRSDHSRKSRGYTTRAQGGEVAPTPRPGSRQPRKSPPPSEDGS